MKSASRPAVPPIAKLATLAAGVAGAADFAGTYHGPTLDVQLSADGAALPGGQPLALTGRPADDGSLRGTFVAGGRSYAFTATLNGDQLAFVTGGKTHVLTRPPAAPAVDGLQLASTAHGRAVVVHEPATASATAALDAVLPLLPGAIGGTVTVTGRFSDARHADRGGASFTATVAGRSVRGVALAGQTNTGGEDVSVAWCAADAPADEWVTLTDALPHPPPPLSQHYVFPDGTGSIDMPAGWRCGAQSAATTNGVVVQGPDGQTVMLAGSMMVNGSQSPLWQAYLTSLQIWRRGQQIANMPRQPKPEPAPGLYAEFTDPVTMLRQIGPQLSALGKAQGMPPSTLDQIDAATPVQPFNPNGQGALVEAESTDGTGASAVHFRSVGRYECDPIPPGGTMLYIAVEFRAKAAHFDRDLPTMQAINDLFHINADRANQVWGETNAAIAKAGQIAREGILERGKIQHDAQAQRFDQIESAIKAQRTAGHRAASDAAEMYSGYQDIVNTRTGERASVDYYNSDSIVNGLNEQAHDPSEWTVAHRRDEQYPLGR
jgi:hypothetical protein